MWVPSASSLKVFQKNIRWNDIQKNIVLFNQSKRIQSCRFKSFFGFFKIKPFVYESKLIFLQYLTLNPKPRTLQKWLENSKKYQPSTLVNPIRSECSGEVSESGLLGVVFKKNSSSLRRLRYLIFKHRIFNYTTPKNIIFRGQTLQWSQQVDIRIGWGFRHIPTLLPNSHTLPTYNWKIIN